MRHREDHVQRHQRLQRVRARLDERADMFADQSALADVDQLFRRLALLRIELVLGRHGVEIFDDAIAQVGAVADLEQQPVETVRFRGRMLVELIAAVLELEAAVQLGVNADRTVERRMIPPSRWT